MTTKRIVHFINQFYAGVGGEEQAGIGPASREGAVGPGLLLNQMVGPEAQVVATVWCGDNYMGEGGEKAAREVAALIAAANPDLVVVGPGFASGRYGLACGQVAKAVRQLLKVPIVGGLHESSPALELSRRTTYIVPTGDSGLTMREAITRIATLSRKLLSGEPIGPANKEGYFPTGRRVNQHVSERGAFRATDMLINRLRGLPFQTESELPHYEPVTPAAPIQDLKRTTVALVSEAGCVPKGNPDRIASSWAETWASYNLDGLDDLRGGDWYFVHGGFDTAAVDDDPDRMVPLDALRAVEAEGGIQRLHPEFLSICGSMAPISTSVRFGQEVAAALKAAGVGACILTAT